MNEMVKKFLLAGDKVMPKIHFRQPRLPILRVNHLPKTKKKHKNSKKQGIQDILIKLSYRELPFNII